MTTAAAATVLAMRAAHPTRTPLRSYAGAAIRGVWLVAAGAASPTAGHASARSRRSTIAARRRLPAPLRRSPTGPGAPTATTSRKSAPARGATCPYAENASATGPAARAHRQKVAEIASRNAHGWRRAHQTATIRCRGQRLLKLNQCQPAYLVLPLGNVVLQLGRLPRCRGQRLLMPGAERRSACREGTQRRRVYAPHPAPSGRDDPLQSSNASGCNSPSPATPAAATAPLQQRSALAPNPATPAAATAPTPGSASAPTPATPAAATGRSPATPAAATAPGRKRS